MWFTVTWIMCPKFSTKKKQKKQKRIAKKFLHNPQNKRKCILRVWHECERFVRRLTKMYRARSVVKNLVPFLPATGHRRFATWLLGPSLNRMSPSSYCLMTRMYSSSLAAEPFMNGTSSTYIEDMYNSWLADPKSVHAVSIKLSFKYVINWKKPILYLC